LQLFIPANNIKISSLLFLIKLLPVQVERSAHKYTFVSENVSCNFSLAWRSYLQEKLSSYSLFKCKSAEERMVILGFKVFVDFGHICHDLLPIWAFYVGHFHNTLKEKECEFSK